MQRPPRLTKGAFERWRDERPAVAIGIPMTATLYRTAVNQFLSLAKHLRDDDVLLPVQETAVVSEARNAIIRAFLDLPDTVDYLFLFDDDMVVPVGTIELMTWRRLPFLSGLCTRKVAPYLPVPSLSSGLRAVEPGSALSQYGDEVELHDPIINWEPDSGLREAHGTGGACLCLSRDLLTRIEAPWFKFEGGGEDLYFCRKVRALGERVMVDTHVRPGHIGEHVATYEDWLAGRDAIPAVDAALRKVG